MSTQHSVQHLVAAAKSGIRNLTTDEVADRLAAGGVTLVDLREQDEVGRDGVIPGAVHAPRGMLEFYADPASPYHRAEFSPGDQTILYCASGGRSALATRALLGLGYTDVAHLDGGLKAWTAEGRPVAPPA
ncbi:rhodanese-like domain-containing protein [Jiangella alkaliphila]|uniref:Rhodanese-related sulfurtransferase n=1 Tax=Jiangella alkaliphila TaxID=419479 RepID=A0A1H2G4U2_9ACTN|nr:rhodanese-like domain-containing protein [Jiangella alkaliphila]SDU14318.1 Rhodanese-related sulfurtransferase [Jiangella alkaliphila]